MKECKNRCDSWRGLVKTDRMVKTTRAVCVWTHCPYCDSGKLVDKEAVLKAEFWQDLYRAAEHNDDTIIFDKYKIERKEDEP